MTNETQKNFVINHLNRVGSIGRNYCLKNHISRLGAIINKMKKEGWLIEAKWVKKDYVYYKKTKSVIHYASENWFNPLYSYYCKTCKKDKDTKSQERAYKGQCQSCEKIENLKNQTKLPL